MSFGDFNICKECDEIDTTADNCISSEETLNQDDILAKIFFARKECTDIVSKRLFDKQIFMGAGHPHKLELNFTGQECAALHKMLDKAFSIISGMQQNGGMGYKYSKEEEIEGKKQIKVILEDIKTALGE